MDMLEKMGMVKKVEDDSLLGPEGSESQSEAPSFAAAPVRDEAAAEPDRPDPVRRAPAKPAQEEAPAAKRQPEPEVRPRPATVHPLKPEKTYGVSDSLLSKSFWEDEDDAEAPITGSPDEDRFLSVEELYERFHLKPAGIDTVYLLEEYIRTLPESLPPEMRRSIVLKIVSASGFDFDRLLNDGIDRVSRLNDYSATFASHTEEVVARYNEEIETLQRQVEGIREAINERKNLHKRQFLELEGEAQRLKDILDFITK